MSSPRDDRGQAIVLVAITILGMVMAVGLAIDSGQLYGRRVSAQEAADSAAFAGATVLYQKGCPWITCTSTEVSVATSAATSDATLNGYATNVPTSDTTVTVASPPSSGSFSGNTLCVQVAISTPVKTTLVPQTEAFTTVKATGTACAAAFNAGYAMMSTDSGCDSKALVESSQGSLKIYGGNLDINSCSTSAGYATGSIRIDTGYGAYIVGGASPWPSVSPGTTTTNTGTVQADPFAGTPGPPTADLTPQSCAGPALSPGIYTCTIGPGAYTMAPGYYIFEGGGFNLNGTSTVTGTGILIFLTDTNYPDSSSCGTHCTCATFGVSGGGSLTISAATTGPYKGMLIFQDPNCTGDVTIGGTGLVATLSGSIYAPTATVVTDGNGASISVSQIVAFQESVKNGNLIITYSSNAAFVGYVPALRE